MEATDNTIYSPLTGFALPLSEVSDAVFATEMMGKGAAVVPTIGKIVAPCNGVIVSVFRTLHAVTIKADNGAEIIIHVGLDTVNLGGKHYESHVIDGQRIEVGDLLLTFDLKAIQAEGYDMVTPVIITNSADYQDVLMTDSIQITQGESLISLVAKA